MKILHIIDSGGLYGAEIMLLNLMREQVVAGDEPVLASIGDTGVDEKPIEKETRRRGMKVVVFRMKPGLNFAGALNILRFAREEKVDILHSHGYKGNILFGFLPRFIRRIPMVSTIHGWTWSGGMTRMLIYEWLDALSLSFVDRVITVNSVMQDHPLIRNRRGLALDVVPNGIPLNSDIFADNSLIGTNKPLQTSPCQGRLHQGFPPDKGGLRGVDFGRSNVLDPAIIDFCSQGFTIGAIGRLSPEKGFDSLLEVVAAFSARDIDIRLVIIGEGRLRNDLEARVGKLGIENSVLMPGYLHDAQQYLPLFSLFAMPSLTEGLPMVLLEAMQAGVPIVASSVGGIPEVLQNGRCGVLVKPGSKEELERAITNIMQNPKEAEERVGAARQRVIKYYSSRRMAEKYLGIYKEVLNV